MPQATNAATPVQHHLLLLLLLLQELPASARWVSEAIFTALLLSFIAWTFTPLLAQRSFSTAVLWTRLLTVLVGKHTTTSISCSVNVSAPNLQLLLQRAIFLQTSCSTRTQQTACCLLLGCAVCQLLRILSFNSTQLLQRAIFLQTSCSTRTQQTACCLLLGCAVCQLLRILSFSSTQLPGPAPHCHAGRLTATRPPVTAWWQHLVVDVRTQVATSCGDLIFSSHMTFILTGKCSIEC
jgi:hypothetical protein